MKLLAYVALLLPVVLLALGGLCIYDLYDSVGKLNRVRVTAGEGHTMLCKAADLPRWYYCVQLYSEPPRDKEVMQ